MWALMFLSLSMGPHKENFSSFIFFKKMEGKRPSGGSLKRKERAIVSGSYERPSGPPTRSFFLLDPPVASRFPSRLPDGYRLPSLSLLCAVSWP